MKNLIQYDILESIDKNIAASNITISDARVLKGVTWQLYYHIYQKYEEMEEAGVNQIVEDAMILETDILEKKHREELKRMEIQHAKVIRERDDAIKAKDNAIKAKDSTIKAKDSTIKELTSKLRSLGISDEEIQGLTS